MKLNGAPIEMVDYSTLPKLLPLEVSSKQLRAVYDQYGETGLREGVPGSACASAGVSRCGG